jgi:toxin ParE1/3/4
MIPKIVFRRRAKNELEDAIEWYDEQRQGLGDEFLRCVEEAISKASQSPLSYAVAFQDVRRIAVRRFPYSVDYRPEEERLVVLAVHHHNRDDSELSRRK